MTMRLLVITYSFYPAQDPRAFRWDAIVKHWVQNGMVVDVVCAKLRIDSLAYEVLNGVHVYRVADPSNRFRSDRSMASPDAPARKGWIKKVIYNLLKQGSVRLRWPDFAWLWIGKAYQKARVLQQQHHYDGIYSVALPFSAHVVAMLLRRHKKDCSWVCDYGDPFSFLKESPVNNTWIYGWLNRYVERKMIQSSQKISVTTLETAQQYVAHLGVAEQWFAVIPPLIQLTRHSCPINGVVNASDDITRECRINRENAPIRLIFAGTLYSQIRNPKFLLMLLSDVRKKLLPRRLELHFYGPIGDCASEFEPYQTDKDPWIVLHGSVDRAALISIYENADVLVNIGNATTYQVPSKVIEYIATGLPILHIASVPGDLSLEMLKLYPAALCLFQGAGDSAEMAQSVCMFLEYAKRVESSVVDEILKNNRSDVISKAYLDLLKKEVV